jgi:large subunit ribosomal protein L21
MTEIKRKLASIQKIEEIKPVVKEEVKVVAEKKATVKVDLTEKTVAELRELAKVKEIKGYSTMKKAELVEALN